MGDTIIYLIRHDHENRQVNSQFTCLYEDIVPFEFESFFEFMKKLYKMKNKKLQNINKI